VLVTSPNIVADIKAAAPNASVRLALDGVTGTATNVLAESLSAEGLVVCYASATKEFLAMDLLTLVAKRLSIHGFSMYYPQFVPKIGALIAESAELMKQGKLVAPITATYPITDVQEAVKHAMRGGKILLDLS
jgi:NADPH:quinone reductase-like Zn-dependent oxidoreductase